jgi:hypothetical protein
LRKEKLLNRPDYSWRAPFFLPCILARLLAASHGYNTNSALGAHNALSTLDKPQTKLTQFGATLGGPIRRDKTFFFADYQGGRNRRGQSTVLSVPTEAFRKGDFRGASVIYDPGLTGTIAASSRQPFENNIIPSHSFRTGTSSIYPMYEAPMSG